MSFKFKLRISNAMLSCITQHVRGISCRKYSECCLWTSRFSDTLASREADRAAPRGDTATTATGTLII